MSVRNAPLAAANISRALVLRGAKKSRHVLKRLRRALKHVTEFAKHLRATVRGRFGYGAIKSSGGNSYRAAVRMSRYLSRIKRQVWPRVQREMAVRADLRRAAASSQPIIVGPWLSEVGYEVLYWVPFLRWVQDRYRIDPARMVVVSRGGVAGWYSGVSERYIEMLDLFTPQEFAALNAARQASGDQKQHVKSAFDEQILAAVRRQPGLADATVCHPSTMFRLLRQFWLGNESLQYLMEYVTYTAPAQLTIPPLALAGLPERFVAIKFYAGVALPKTPENYALVRDLVRRLAEQGPVVTLETGLALDEHEDYRFLDVPGVVSIAEWLTPQNNLAVQSEVIRRASRFVGTCGGLAWLAPMLGTPTLAVYADDAFLGPHLYAARHAFGTMGAAPFAALDLNALALMGTDRLDDTPV